MPTVIEELLKIADLQGLTGASRNDPARFTGLSTLIPTGDRSSCRPPRHDPGPVVQRWVNRVESGFRRPASTTCKSSTAISSRFVPINTTGCQIFSLVRPRRSFQMALTGSSRIRTGKDAQHGDLSSRRWRVQCYDRIRVWWRWGSFSSHALDSMRFRSQLKTRKNGNRPPRRSPTEKSCSVFASLVAY